METVRSSDRDLSSGGTRPTAIIRRLQLVALATCMTSLSAAGCAGGFSSAGLSPVRSTNDSLSKPGTGPITEFTISAPHEPPVRALPIGITNGPDGAIWFAERGWGRLGRILTDGTITNQFDLRVRGEGPSFHPQRLVTGPDGNLWATCGTLRRYRQLHQGVSDPYGSIRRMTTNGDVTAVVHLQEYSDPRSIVSAPDGNLWFTESRGSIGEVSPNGKGKLLREIPLHHHVYPIALGPNGNIWFGELFNNRIGKITLPYVDSEIIKYYVLAKNAGPDGIVAGPGGYLYFTERLVGKVGKIDKNGHLAAEWQLPAGSTPTAITVGSDGNIYVAEFGMASIARIVPTGHMAGTITQFPTPTQKSGPWGVLSGPDGNIWFTEALAGKIGRLSIYS